jgi:hypothetical protein
MAKNDKENYESDNERDDLEEQRRRALEMADEEAQANSRWFSIKQDQTKRTEILCLDNVPCPEYVPKMFKGYVQKKTLSDGRVIDMMCYKYTVLDRSNGTIDPKPQAFEIGKNSHKLIKAELEKGHWLLDITRTGTKTDTLYTPKPVQ